MKSILLTTAAVFALTGVAHAQTVTATPGESVASQFGESSTAKSAGEKAIAITKFGGGPNGSNAEVGTGVTAKAGGTDGALSGSVHIGANSNNLSAMLQIGTANHAVNMQVGNHNETALLQLGANNNGVLSQDGSGNESALSQVGEDNTTVLAQDGDDNAAASAAWGDDNKAMGLQLGNNNMLAMAQEHNNNTAVILQEGNGNTAASVQDGSNNQSFISQGAGTSFSLTDLTPTTHTENAPAFFGGSVAALGATGNAAASLQYSNGNQSAIVQTGINNTAINYQN